jgi:hypothetical protein
MNSTAELLGTKVPESNFDFLLALFGAAHANNAFVTGFPEDPAGQHDMRIRARMWRGQRWGDLKQPLSREWNNYYCISTFKPNSDPKDHNQPRRKKALHHATHVVVFDDVGNGQKVPWEHIKLPASYVLMTSPGNHQVGYRLAVPETDAGKVERFIDGLIVNGLASDSRDPGMRGVTRFVRLPAGTNRKSKYGTLGIVCSITEWAPERVFTIEQLAAAHGISLAAPQRDGPARPRIQLPDEDRRQLVERMLTALERQGHIIGEDPNAPGKWHIVCPWTSEHSEQDQSGTAYFEPGYVDRTTGIASEKGGFKCWHGHCENKHLNDLVAWLRAHGHNEVMHPNATLEFHNIVEEEQRMPADKYTALVRDPEDNRIKSQVLTNVELIMLYDRVVAGSVRFNTFTHTHEILRSELNNLDSVVAWMITEIERVYHTTFAEKNVRLMLNRLMDQNRYDPLMEWASATRDAWDGTARLDRCLLDHAVAVAQPADYVQAVTRAFFIGAAQRALCPGYKFDHMLILEGKQGIGKSTLCRILAPRAEWAAAGILDVAHKDAVADLLGKFIYEVEELQTFRRTKDVDALKAFLSRVSDRVRLSYRRDSGDYARRTVFIGTTNKRKYLETDEPDPQRRFWPVSVAAVDLSWFQDHAAQLWAEALWHAYEGELPVLDMDIISVVEEQQLERARSVEEHPWYQALHRMWNDPEYRNAWPAVTTNNEILSMLGVSTDRQDRRHEMVIADILKALGYRVERKRLRGTMTRCWVRELDDLLL